MSAMASGKEAHHRVHYYAPANYKPFASTEKLASTPHRVLARMVGSIKKNTLQSRVRVEHHSERQGSTPRVHYYTPAIKHIG